MTQVGPSRQLLALADGAHQGAGPTARTPCYRHHELPQHHQQYNRALARLRAPGEHVFARLKQWRIPHKARCSTNRIGRTVAAVHAIGITWRSRREAFSDSADSGSAEHAPSQRPAVRPPICYGRTGRRDIGGRLTATSRPSGWSYRS
ncbi:transposase family protein [Streptomyces sp. NPDC014986]|uniref:transposase family protein n=1 Tax=Streptomyces sp. NPDC014986 TaxID=3364934 RepID=UPI0036FAFB6B